MAQPTELLAQFAAAVQNQNDVEANQTKSLILALELTSALAATARYRVGLHVLHHDKKLDEAMAIIKDVAECKIDCPSWYDAQISYALCLWAKDKKQQSIFELRKVLSESGPAGIHKGIALDYLAIFLRENSASAQDIAKVDQERIDVLSQLSHAEKSVADASQIQLRLAAAFEERGQAGDQDKARAILKELQTLASRLPKSTATAAKEALKRIDPNPRR